MGSIFIVNIISKGSNIDMLHFEVTVDLPNMSVVEWLNKISPIFKRIDEDCVYSSCIAAMEDLLIHGCTTAIDHQ